MAERYDRMDNQSPVQTTVENSDMSVPRSAFDFSCVHSGNALIGAVIPVDCFDVVPNEDITMSIDGIIDLRNPLSRPLLNGMRVYFHSYYNDLTDIWEGAKNFLDTGLSGKIALTRPQLRYSISFANTQGSGTLKATAATPLSLMNYLGIPCEQLQSESAPLWWFKSAFVRLNQNHNASVGTLKGIANSPDYIAADPFFCYQRNWRDYYANRNLLQNNKYWYPDNEDHFILSYGATLCTCICYENEDLRYDDSGALRDDATRYAAIYQNMTGHDAYTDLVDTEGSSDEEIAEIAFEETTEPNNPATVAPDGSFTNLYAPNLCGLKFRQFRGDRFTASLPFPDIIRGDIPVLGDFSEDDYVKYVNSSGDVQYINGKHSYGENLLSLAYSSGNASVGTRYDTSPHSLQVSSSITLNDIRALETMTVFKERMARLPNKDAYYNEVIEAQFGYNPHIHSRTATYIGGFYMDMSFGSVVQTSQSTTDSPLGQRAGSGSAAGSGFIGNFHVKNFGWIQTYMSIVPDVMYTQGLPKMFFKNTQEMMYFPIFNNLAPQAILNKEIFISGNASKDNDVFAYEDRYSEYKSRPNRVSGLMALPRDVAYYDTSRIMARRFTQTPSLNSTFVSMIPENIDMEVFSVNDEPPFDFSLALKVRRVFPGPYTAVPGSLSSNLHA